MTNNDISAMIVAESNDIIYIADPETYKLIYLNQAALKILGNPPREDWYLKPCYQILQNMEAPCPFCNNHKLTTDKYYIWDHYNQQLDRYFTIKDKLILIDGKAVRLELATDITNRELSNQKLRHKLEEVQTLVSCIQTLNEDTDTRKAINRLLQIIGSYHHAERAYIFEFTDKFISNTYEWCKSGILPQIDNLQNLPIESVDRWMEQFQENGEFFITSLGKTVDKDSLEYEILEPQGIESLMAAPIWYKNKVVGFLGVDNPTVNTDSMTLLRSAASFIINDIGKRKLMEQLTRLSYTDSLTGTGNRHDYIRMLNTLEAAPPSSLGIIFLDINGLKATNDTYGHKCGDALIQHTANVLLQIFPHSVYRIGGDEFVVICTGISEKEFNDKVERITRSSKEDSKLNISMGISWQDTDINISRQVAYTDELMYANKRNYYHTADNINYKQERTSL